MHRTDRASALGQNNYISADDLKFRATRSYLLHNGQK